LPGEIANQGDREQAGQEHSEVKTAQLHAVLQKILKIRNGM
jgi:hypothetical protein